MSPSDPAGEDVRALLERRAERVRAQPPPPEDDSALRVAEFQSGEERFAIGLDLLRAAIPLRSVTPVPLAPAHVIGIVRFHGQIVTAISLAALLGRSGFRQDPTVLLVVDAGGGALFAVDCEQIPKPAAIPNALVDEARAGARRAITTIAMDGQRSLLLLDLPLLLERLRGAGHG